MNMKAIEQAKDSDLASSMNAMRRAVKRARQVAAQTGTFLVIQHGEQIERIAVTDQDDTSKKTA
jgi:hypothetical protein